MLQHYRQDQSFIFSQMMAQRLSILQMGQAKLSLLIAEAASKNPMLDSSKIRTPNNLKKTIGYPDDVSETIQQEEKLYDRVKNDILMHWENSDAELLYLILGSLDSSGFLGVNGIDLCKDTPFDGERTEFLRQKIMEESIPGLAAINAKEYYIYAARSIYGDQSLAHKVAVLLAQQTKKITPAKIAELLKIDLPLAESSLKELASLSASPLPRESKAIIPDFIVSIQDNKLVIKQVSTLKPGVLIPDGQTYTSEELSHFRKEAQMLIDAITAREEALQKHAEALILSRSDFFFNNNSQAPIVGLKEIAAITGRHMSTVSRALKGRYFIFEKNIYPFSTLWSHKIGGKSSSLVKNELKKIINHEDKSSPLSDEEIQAILEKQGFKIARRTVAKYREIMNIPGMYQRKKGGAL
ncbi:MAG: hypothetical protein ACRC9L_06785 [Brevinema sp.]